MIVITTVKDKFGTNVIGALFKERETLRYMFYVSVDMKGTGHNPILKRKLIQMSVTERLSPNHLIGFGLDLGKGVVATLLEKLHKRM